MNKKSQLVLKKKQQQNRDWKEHKLDNEQTFSRIFLSDISIFFKSSKLFAYLPRCTIVFKNVSENALFRN